MESPLPILIAGSKTRTCAKLATGSRRKLSMHDRILMQSMGATASANAFMNFWLSKPMILSADLAHAISFERDSLTRNSLACT